MERVLLIVLMMAGTFAHAQSKAVEAACRELVVKTIKEEAKKLGQTKEFTVKLFRKGSANPKKKLIEYKSGNFLVPGGVIANSWASVIVRYKGASCEIVRKSVGTGR